MLRKADERLELLRVGLPKGSRPSDNGVRFKLGRQRERELARRKEDDATGGVSRGGCGQAFGSYAIVEVFLESVAFQHAHPQGVGDLARLNLETRLR